MSGALRLYSGQGVSVSQRNERLPLFEPLVRLNAPELYVAEKGLTDAVNVALALGQPLLVTGDPGTGKTQLAASVACELELPPPLTFHEDGVHCRDLFYQYDARTLSRFALSQDGLNVSLHHLRSTGPGDSAVPPQWRCRLLPARRTARQGADTVGRADR